MPKVNDVREIMVNVLGVREDDEWQAIALELNLVGFGDSFESAVADLNQTIEAQISFAVQHDTLDSIFVPADPKYLQIYADIRRASIKSSILNSEWMDRDYVVRDIPLPKPGPEAFAVA